MFLRPDATETTSRWDVMGRNVDDRLLREGKVEGDDSGPKWDGSRRSRRGRGLIRGIRLDA